MGRPQFTRRNEEYSEELSRQGETRTVQQGVEALNNADPSTVGGSTEILERKDADNNENLGDEVINHIQTSAQGFPKYNGLLVFECNDGIGGENLWLMGVNPGESLALTPALPYPDGHVLQVRAESYTGGTEYCTVSFTVS